MILYFIFIAHFISDFVLQSDKQADAKSTSNKALTAHVATYTAGLLVLTIAGMALLGTLTVWMFLWVFLWAITNGVLHWGIDWCTSRLNKWLFNNRPTHDFFVGIGFDQWVLHAGCLLWTSHIFQLL